MNITNTQLDNMMCNYWSRIHDDAETIRLLNIGKLSVLCEIYNVADCYKNMDSEKSEEINFLVDLAIFINGHAEI